MTWNRRTLNQWRMCNVCFPPFPPFSHFPVIETSLFLLFPFDQLRAHVHCTTYAPPPPNALLLILETYFFLVILKIIFVLKLEGRKFTKLKTREPYPLGDNTKLNKQ